MRFSFRRFFAWIAILISFSLPIICHSQVNSIDNKNLSLDLVNVSLPDALQELAKFMHRSLLLSPAITGVVSLHLNSASPREAFDLLLTSEGLGKLATGDVLFIAPQAELMKRRQDESKMQEVIGETAKIVTRTWQIHYAKAEDIALLIKDANNSLLSKRGHVRVDARTNMLCIQDSPQSLAEIYSLILKLDVPIKQILIEARLASVDGDYERDLGINFSTHQSVGIGGKSEVVPQHGTHFSLAVATLANGSILDATLSAMENEGHGELISSPSLFTANGQTASIESGEEIPYQEVSLSGGTGVAFKKAVLSLKVTPQIMPGNKVLLKLKVNQDRPSSRMVLGVPAITTRQITTNILIESGQTLVLGGIYEINNEENEQRIPFLGKIPFVGLLFKEENVKKNKRELLIFVTPKIIS